MVHIAKTSDVPVHCGKIVPVEGQVVALFNLGDQFCAIDNNCPHRGGPLGEGDLEGTVVTCPWHSWRFDLVTGENPDIPGEKIKTYPVKVEGEEILIEL